MTVVAPGPHRHLRLATVAWFSPKKLGSGEDAAIAFAKGVRERGHAWTLFCFDPVHPAFASALEAAGARRGSLSTLQRQPLRAWRRFAAEFDVVELSLVAPRSRLAAAAYFAWPCSVVFIDRVSAPPRSEGMNQHWVSRFLDRYTMLRVTTYVGVSEYVRTRGQQRFRMNREKTTVIYNGIDVSRFRPLDALDVRKKTPAERGTILTVASLIQEKGIDVLLRAVAASACEDWQLQIVGEGPQAGALKALAQHLGIGARTQFLGLRDDVDRLMREADIFVHPAVWQEAFGMTVVEVMASGCCVLASRVGGIPELLEDRVEGVLVEPGNVSALAQSIAQCAHDPRSRRRMGIAARARVMRDFTIEDRIAREITVLENAATR